MSQSLHIKGAQVWDGEENIQRDLYIKHSKIVAVRPHDALEVDLEGFTIFPGLINAHDHLELNHFPRTKFRDVYDNAHQWGEDVNARLNDEPFKTLRSYPLWDRVFIGGLKNLLCGATTVAHHGPPHKPMFRKDFPVRVLKNYGWAHSLHFNTEEEIIRSYKNTPKNVPWFIHLAEGTDEVAASEYQRLKKLGCVDENTVIVHGVGMTEEDIADAAKIVRGLVWCPSTNAYLLEETTFIHHWMYHKSNLAVGSDSRLTADGDLMLEQALEIDTADIIDDISWSAFSDYTNFPVNSQSAQIIGWNSNFPKIGSEATFFLPSLDSWRRSHIFLIVVDGIPQIGNPDMMAKFPHVQTVACTLDGVEKRMHIDLARQVHRCTLQERGLEVDDLPKGKRFIFF